MSEGEKANIKPEMMKSYLWLEFADGSIQQVEARVAMFCPKILQEVITKKEVVGSSKNKAIFLQVDPTMLSLIFDFCRFHQVPGRSYKECKKYNEKFFRMDAKSLSELLSVADSLLLKPLVALISRALHRISHLTEEKNTMNARRLNKLDARKRKELEEREKLKSVEVEEHVVERSVDDLVTYIDGDEDPKVKKTSKSKKKKNKRKDKKNGTSDGTCVTSEKSAEIVNKTASSSGDVSEVVSMEDDSSTSTSESEDGYTEDEFDPAWNEIVNREVAELDKRLKDQEKGRLQGD